MYGSRDMGTPWKSGNRYLPLTGNRKIFLIWFFWTAFTQRWLGYSSFCSKMYRVTIMDNWNIVKFACHNVPVDPQLWPLFYKLWPKSFWPKIFWKFCGKTYRCEHFKTKNKSLRCTVLEIWVPREKPVTGIYRLPVTEKNFWFGFSEPPLPSDGWGIHLFVLRCTEWP